MPRMGASAACFVLDVNVARVTLFSDAAAEQSLVFTRIATIAGDSRSVLAIADTPPQMRQHGEIAFHSTLQAPFPGRDALLKLEVWEACARDAAAPPQDPCLLGYAVVPVPRREGDKSLSQCELALLGPTGHGITGKLHFTAHVCDATVAPEQAQSRKMGFGRVFSSLRSKSRKGPSAPAVALHPVLVPGSEVSPKEDSAVALGDIQSPAELGGGHGPAPDPAVSSAPSWGCGANTGVAELQAAANKGPGLSVSPMAAGASGFLGTESLGSAACTDAHAHDASVGTSGMENLRIHSPDASDAFPRRLSEPLNTPPFQMGPAKSRDDCLPGLDSVRPRHANSGRTRLDGGAFSGRAASSHRQSPKRDLSAVNLSLRDSKAPKEAKLLDASSFGFRSRMPGGSRVMLSQFKSAPAEMNQGSSAKGDVGRDMAWNEASPGPARRGFFSLELQQEVHPEACATVEGERQDRQGAGQDRQREGQGRQDGGHDRQGEGQDRQGHGAALEAGPGHDATRASERSSRIASVTGLAVSVRTSKPARSGLQGSAAPGPASNARWGTEPEPLALWGAPDDPNMLALSPPRASYLNQQYHHAQSIGNVPLELLSPGSDNCSFRSGESAEEVSSNQRRLEDAMEEVKKAELAAAARAAGGSMSSAFQECHSPSQPGSFGPVSRSSGGEAVLGTVQDPSGRIAGAQWPALHDSGLGTATLPSATLEMAVPQSRRPRNINFSGPLFFEGSKASPATGRVHRGAALDAGSPAKGASHMMLPLGLSQDGLNAAGHLFLPSDDSFTLEEEGEADVPQADVALQEEVGEGVGPQEGELIQMAIQMNGMLPTGVVHGHLAPLERPDASLEQVLAVGPARALEPGLGLSHDCWSPSAQQGRACSEEIKRSGGKAPNRDFSIGPLRGHPVAKAGSQQGQNPPAGLYLGSAYTVHPLPQGAEQRGDAAGPSRGAGSLIGGVAIQGPDGRAGAAACGTGGGGTPGAHAASPQKMRKAAPKWATRFSEMDWEGPENPWEPVGAQAGLCDPAPAVSPDCGAAGHRSGLVMLSADSSLRGLARPSPAPARLFPQQASHGMNLEREFDGSAALQLRHSQPLVHTQPPQAALYSVAGRMSAFPHTHSAPLHSAAFGPGPSPMDTRCGGPMEAAEGDLPRHGEAQQGAAHAGGAGHAASRSRFADAVNCSDGAHHMADAAWGSAFSQMDLMSKH